jgi:hypothetical protein
MPQLHDYHSELWPWTLVELPGARGSSVLMGPYNYHLFGTNWIAGVVSGSVARLARRTSG